MIINSVIKHIYFKLIHSYNYDDNVVYNDELKSRIIKINFKDYIKYSINKHDDDTKMYDSLYYFRDFILMVLEYVEILMDIY